MKLIWLSILLSYHRWHCADLRDMLEANDRALKDCYSRLATDATPRAQRQLERYQEVHAKEDKQYRAEMERHLRIIQELSSKRVFMERNYG